MKKNIKPEPAIFYNGTITYRADTCEALKAAASRGELDLTGFARGCYPGQKLPPAMMPELCVSNVWDAKTDQKWGLDEHRNEGIELGYLSRGKLDFTVDGELYQLQSGDLTVTRPWQPHQVGSPLIGASRMHWLIIDLDVRRPNEQWHWPDWLTLAPHDLTRLTELLSHNEQPVWKGNQNIENCFESFAACYETDNPESVQSRMQLYINQLFLELYEILQQKNIKLDSHLTSTRRSVEMFLNALPKHIDYPWTLASMAKHCNLGRSRFAHYCKLITNMTPSDFLAHCRVEKAKKMLQNQLNLSITDIAFTCGFESSQYFATVFKRFAGVTPSQYRNG
ncbi:MAG: AraC family transcriptional regulator [Phycisphaerae bacterium]|nr:AraC family transcriptional regulator [Phycisphaerae bacterium]